MDYLARIRQRRLPPAADAVADPDAPLAPGVVRRGLQLSTIEGGLSNVHVSITAGAFQTGFALLLGASDFTLGLLGAVPFLGQFAQFGGAYLEERLGERRRMTAISALFSRALWLPIAMLPFVAILEPTRLPLFILFVALAQILIGITTNAWTSWMSDLVPPRQRGRYFGTRNMVASVTAMISTWGGGRILDNYQSSGREAMGYAVIFGGAVLCAVAGVAVLWQQPEPPMRRRQAVSRALFSEPLQHPRFRAFSFAAAGWAIAIGVAVPFFNAYGLQTLHLTFEQLALFAVVTSAVTIVTQPFIGRFQDRYGDQRVLVISVIGVVLLPWGWVLATPTFLLPLWINSIFSGVFWPGISQGLINLLMDRAPPEGRGAYVAMYSAVTGVGTFVASVCGGLLATTLGSTLIHLGPLTLNNYAVLFVMSSVGRAIMAWVFARRM